LPILVHEAVGDEERLQAAYQVAAAWELGNMAAAQLDAWQDQDTEGALWRRIGPGRAVNLSVGLIGLSFRMLTDLVEAGLLPAPVVVVLPWRTTRRSRWPRPARCSALADGPEPWLLERVRTSLSNTAHSERRWAC
jgi:hypothetical protein